ncbi:HD domain-containing protein [Amycolatopsis sp. OK19-0408]|uniref:HD domain-containing protein n=1 Tax=Amycolatopsis iheyensis TaxID=2945988 RepID=A0A9X2NGZ8_9PSEU|nr:HD domain-containing protein [Amycolatopsis iheyensis]MCR6487206.1 HD domain-containing protein [Amycolatopsis iheyensis]
MPESEAAARARPERSTELVRKTEQIVRSKLHNESTGHDWWHADRVRSTAVRIAREESADELVVELAALLHDVEDFKFSGSEDTGPRFAGDFLRSIGVAEQDANHVADIIRNISFKGARVTPAPLTLEGHCIQDADRLDAIGAIGIARTFAYGGYRRRPIHDPEVAPVEHDSVQSYLSTKGTTINHFHEKLLLLRDRMNTEFGRKLAEERHRFMEGFLAEFDSEWKGER